MGTTNRSYIGLHSLHLTPHWTSLVRSPQYLWKRAKQCTVYHFQVNVRGGLAANLHSC